MDEKRKKTESVSSQEELILKAAQDVFVSKGYAAARMQEIADEAGVNKALVHYYFRSKEKLFHRIFKSSFKSFWPSLEFSVLNNLDIANLLQVLISTYIGLLERMPYLPNFIISEINRDPKKVQNLIQETGIQPDLIIGAIEKALLRENILNIDARELLLNTISICIFPVLSRPLTASLLWGNDKAYIDYLTNRKSSILSFVKGALGLQSDHL